MKDTILIVEDDQDIIELLTLYLEGNGFYVKSALNGADALHILTTETVDLAIIDIMMPEMNGYELIRKLRSENNQIPIIILSAKGLDVDRVLGLDIGADAYLTKPFNPLEVIATVRALLRRCRILKGDHLLTVGELILDLDTYLLKKSGKSILLTSSEVKILTKMMKNPGRIFTKGQLYQCISGESLENDENTMIVHISNLRSKIEDNPAKPKYIKTIRGLGYKFDYEKE